MEEEIREDMFGHVVDSGTDGRCCFFLLSEPRMSQGSLEGDAGIGIAYRHQLHQLLSLSTHTSPQRLRVLQKTDLALRQHVLRALPSKRINTSQPTLSTMFLHDVNDYAATEDVGRKTIAPFAENFRGNVTRGATADRLFLLGTMLYCQSEIC